MTHEEAIDLAGLYVLDALTPEERAAVDSHLRTCLLAHPEFSELGGVTPALASLAPPAGAPAALKRRVLEEYGVATLERQPVPASRRPRRPWHGWMGWATAAAAVLVFAVVGVWAVGQRNDADQAAHRAQMMADAVAAMTSPGAQVAMLSGSGTAQGAHGFAAFPASGGGYVVMTDLPAPPSGMAYQAWYMVGGQAMSAGVMDVDENGELVAAGMQPMPGTSEVAFTLEPMGGSDEPTSAPLITGDLATHS